MPINPNIIAGLNTKPLEFGDPMERYAKSQQLRNLMQTGDIQQQQIQDAAAIRNATMQAGGDQEALGQKLLAAGQLTPYKELQKYKLEAAEKQSVISKNITDTQAKAIAQHRDELNNVTDANSAAQWIQAGYTNPILKPILSQYSSPEISIQNMQQAFQTPEGAQQWKEKNAMGAQKFLEMNKPKPIMVDKGDTIQPGSQLPTGEFTPKGDPLKKGISPTAASRSPYDEDGNLIPGTLDKYKGIIDAVGTYDQPATLALSRTPSDIKSVILAEIKNKYPDYGPHKYNENKKIISDFSAGGKSAIEVKAANTALNHIETLRELAKAQAKADKTGDFQPFNKIANAAATMFGGTAPSNLTAAVSMVGPELTRSFAGAQMAAQDREHTLKALNSKAASAEQFQGVLDQASDLLGGRLVENERTYARSGRKDFRTDKFLSPAALNVLKHQEEKSTGKTVVKTGNYGGKKVIQYSDGSIEYAN